jgi:hypothetical protein
MIVLNSPAARRQAVMTMIAFASLTAACSSNSSDDAKPASVDQRRSVVEKQPTPNTPQRAPRQEAAAPDNTGEVPQQILALFRDDLARRALVKPETITVVGAAELQWPDGSLGCPKPGEMYTQMIVPGYRVVLQANGERYAYHSDQRGKFVVCANGLALPPAQQQMKSPTRQ